MSIASYNALSSDTPVNSGANTTSVTGNPQDANSATSLENEFISLMVAQIQNQDPLNPLDGTEYVSQLAQFSQVQSTENMASMMQTAWYCSITCKYCQRLAWWGRRFMCLAMSLK